MRAVAGLLCLSSAALLAQSPITISPSTVPNGTLGAPYSQTLTATGGRAPYTFSVSAAAGPLPAGLSLSPQGVISGTPTSLGTYSFTVAALDSSQRAGQQSYRITISLAPVVITMPALPAGTVYVSYSQALTASGGTGSYTWAVKSGSLPSGLVLSPQGLVFGTPVNIGTFTFTVQVSSPQPGGPPLTATQSFNLAINPPPLVIITSSLPFGVAGIAYSQVLAATGGVGNYVWSITSGYLPAGLTLTPSGLISGTPTSVGTSGFTVQVASAGITQSASFSIRILPPNLTIATDALPDGTVAANYAATLTAAGGVMPYSWSVSAGAPPNGLILGPSGILSGVPLVAGTFSFTAQVTDSAQTQATMAFRVTIIAALKITTTSLPPGVVGTAYSLQFAATGGVPPYTWSVSGGALPGGFTLDAATGTLSGTPDKAGVFTSTISAQDKGGRQDAVAFSLTIAAPLVISTAGPLPDGTTGAAYSQQFAAAGGTAPYQWSLSAGSVPGLQMNSTSGTLSGTPASTGSFNFTVQVTDAASRRAAKPFTLTVGASLAITTAGLLPDASVGSAYRGQLAAAGGKPPYRWSADGLPVGIALDAASGLLSGTPTAAGTFSFTVAVTDGQQNASGQFQIQVGVPATPPVTISGPPDSPQPATQPAMALAVGAPYPVDITGQVVLTFAPDSGPDDPAVQFTSGGRTVSFRIAAGSTQGVFSSQTVGVQTGTVAGTITLTASLQAAGVDVTPAPAPARVLRIGKSAPVIVSATVQRTSGGFDLVVIGYATTREIVSAGVTYTAAPGVTLQNSQSTVQLGPLFAAWYQGAQSAAFGSQFSLRLPFTIQGATNPLTGLSITLTSAQGTSAAANASF